MVPEEAARPESLREGFRTAIRFALEHPHFSRLPCELQAAEGAAGEAARAIRRRLRDELVEDLPRFGGTIPDDAALRVDLLQAMTAQAQRGLLEGEYHLEPTLDLLARQAQASFET